jgi:hypothetical protein
MPSSTKGGSVSAQNERRSAGHEERADRGVGDEAVEHHRRRRRDQDAERAAAGDHAERAAAAVAVAQHLRDRDLADGERGGDRRAGDRREHRAGEHGGDAEATRQVAHQRVRGGVEVVDHLPAHHEMRHQHEQRDRDQQVDVELAEHELAERRDVALDHDQHREREQEHPGEHRDAGVEQRQQRHEDDKERHSWVSNSRTS